MYLVILLKIIYYASLTDLTPSCSEKLVFQHYENLQLCTDFNFVIKAHQL